MTTRINKTLSLAVLLHLGGCGGAPTTTTTAETTSGAEGPVTATGEVVTAEAQTRWSDALAAYNTAREGGFTPAECTSVISGFESANNAQSGRFTEAIYMVGVTHQQCGHEAEAQTFFDRALQTNANFCGARVAAGNVHYRAGRIDQAWSEYERAVTADPRGCAEGYLNRAIIRMARNDAREALNDIRRALAIDASYMPAFNELARLYYDQAVRGIDITAVQGGTAAAPARAANNNARESARTPQLDRRLLDLAAVVCLQASRVDANYAPIYNTWGLIYIRQGNVFEALRAFERAFNLDANLFEAWMNFGELTLSFRGYQDAENAFRHASTLRTDNYDAYLGLGAALRGLGRADDAQAAYERAIQISATRPEAYFNLGLLWQDYKGGSEQDYARARTFYEQFVSHARGNTEYAQTLDSVEHRCQTEQGRRRRRWRRDSCQMGRIQQMENSLEIRRQMAEVQAMAAQQQAAQPAPTPAETPAPTP